MPIGSYATVPALAQACIQVRPQSVLDLGMGFGGGGVVIRQWVDLGVRPWRTHLVGVEAWQDYRNPVWDLYNVVYTTTIEEYVAACREKFDCILLCDVIEHFAKQAGCDLIAAIKPLVAAGGSLLLTTPAEFYPQQAAHGNERECHRSFWSPHELVQLNFRVERAGKPELCCGEALFAEWKA